MIDVSAFAETLDGKPVAVFGLGISNLAVMRALVKAGVSVTAWDDCGKRRAIAEKEGAHLKDLTQEDLSTYACLVLAPGVPLHHPEPHPVVAAAEKAGIEIICDLEILHRCHHGRKVIGVTGTNGKSTTTALIGHVLNSLSSRRHAPEAAELRGRYGSRATRFEPMEPEPSDVKQKDPVLQRDDVIAVTGGNIGQAALDMALPPEDGFIVLEVSSFQMDLCPDFTPDIAVHLNFSPDHLERHGTMEEYVSAKKRMFEGTGSAIIGVDDDYSRNMFEDVKKTGARDIYPISATDNSVSTLDAPALPGVHNRQNAAAAYKVAELAGLKAPEILGAINTFPGMQHRQYLVRVINGVSWINDSKATNVAATETALSCYNNIYWIAGGRPKDGGLEGLEDYQDHVKHAFLIGEAAGSFAKWCAQHEMEYTTCHTLEQAVNTAFAMAKNGDTVLLSPACASFDQFSSFEERGNVFCTLVNNLKEKAA